MRFSVSHLLELKTPLTKVVSSAFLYNPQASFVFIEVSILRGSLSITVVRLLESNTL